MRITDFVKRLLRKIIGDPTSLNNKIIFNIHVAIFNFIGGSYKVVYKIKPLNHLIPYKKILSGYSYCSKTEENLMITVPDLNLYQVKNALINSRSSTIIQGGNIYYESINDNERFNEGYIISHTKRNALVNHIQIEKITDGFFLAGNGSFNWYHWIIEILPKLLYFDERVTKNILVDKTCENILSMADSLQAITANLNIKIIYLNPTITYKVKNLYYINEVNKLMFNTLADTHRATPFYYYRKDSLQILAITLKKLFLNNDNSPKRIYLERKNTHRIAQNESQILKTLFLHGFNNIDLSTLSLGEQINYFYKAKTLVGTTGAAWTNILFCKPNTKVIIFMPNNYKDYQFYQEIAQMLNIELTYLYYENGSANHDKSNFSINLEEMIQLIKTGNE